MSKLINYTLGQKIGLLTLVKILPKEKGKSRRGVFICPCCNNEFESSIENAKRTPKCRPCTDKSINRSNFNKSHGLKNHQLYKIWNGIKNRCYNSKVKIYPNYGGRGIEMCEEWKNSVVPFYNWAINNGWSKELQIDRIDNNGNYCPENCRFVTSQINNRNRRKEKGITTSNYIGVIFDKTKKVWKSYITIDGKIKYFPQSLSEKEALQKRNNFIKENNLYGFNIQEWINPS